MRCERTIGSDRTVDKASSVTLSTLGNRLSRKIFGFGMRFGKSRANAVASPAAASGDCRKALVRRCPDALPRMSRSTSFSASRSTRVFRRGAAIRYPTGPRDQWIWRNVAGTARCGGGRREVDKSAGDRGCEQRLDAPSSSGRRRESVHHGQRPRVDWTELRHTY